MPDQSRYRCHLSDGSVRDVTASTEESAGRTALYAERVTGNKTRRLRVVRVERLWPIGRQSQRRLFEEGAGE